MRQSIRFCTARDGVRIAYATSGEAAAGEDGQLAHAPRVRLGEPHVFRELSTDHLLLRYDDRGNGLSDWDAEDISFEAWVRDLELVVDSAGLERFALFEI